MPVLQKGVAAIVNRMPKVIGPKGHAIADYATVGTFFLLGGLFWRRHRRAAVSAFICGGSELANTLLTSSPGGVTGLISFPTHGKIDMGLAATCAALPDFMAFADDSEAKWFRIMALNLTTVNGLTDFGGRGRTKRRRQAA